MLFNYYYLVTHLAGILKLKIFVSITLQYFIKINCKKCFLSWGKINHLLL